MIISKIYIFIFRIIGFKRKTFMQRFFISKIQLKYWLGRQHLWWIPDPERSKAYYKETIYYRTALIWIFSPVWESQNTHENGVSNKVKKNSKWVSL